MKYEKTEVKNNIKDAAKNTRELQLKQVSTSSIIWHLVKRHKFALVSTYAVVLTVVWIFPPLPDLLLSLV